MGTIITSKRSQDKIIFKILLDLEEASYLKNHMKNVYFFSANLCNEESNMIKRGNNEVVKYFNIPRNLRINKKKLDKKIAYQKIETPSKVFYVFTMDKNRLL